MKILLISFFIALSISISGQSRWIKFNGPVGGMTRSLYILSDTVIAGIGDNFGNKCGLYYSFDQGKKWYSSIKLFQRIVGIIKADDNSIIFTNCTNGIYKTTDFKTYHKLFSTGEYFLELFKDKTGTLYTGTDIGNIYISTNNGQSWILSLNTGHEITSFAQLSDSTVFASTRDYLYYKKPGKGWNSIYIDGFWDVNVSTDKFDNIYVFNSGTMRMSTDKGKTWLKRDTLGFFYGNYMYSCVYNNRLIVACGDETSYFGNGWGIAVSDDMGLTWRWSNEGFPPKFYGTIHFATSGNDTYVGTNCIGIYKSTNFGDSWFPVNNGIYSADVINLTFDKEGSVYASCFSNGLYKSTDNGLTWEIKNKGMTNSYLYSVIADDNDIMLTSTDQGTFRSTDKGENWIKTDDYFFYSFYKDNSNRIYGSFYGNGLYRTTDQGTSWTKLLSAFVFGFAADSSGNLYTGDYGGRIYKSTDDGSSWSTVYQSTVSGSEVSKITIAPNGTVFATNVNEGILRSTDNGSTWKLVKADNGWPAFYPVTVDKNGVIYAAGSPNKFLTSADNGETWKDITDNLTLTEIRDIKFDKDGNMFLATDESVWRSNPDYAVSIKEEIKPDLSYSLSQNYPNPFNPATEIKYSIPAAGYVSIKVHDILGKEISSLVSEQKLAGEYTVTFNGSKYPSGVYFYIIRAGNFTQTKKLMLLK